MTVSVLSFPGSNCDQDAVYACREVMGVTTQLVWHQEHKLPADTRLVVIPGGFSYGDALRAGALARFSPIMADVIQFAAKGGLVFGICNGFQILVEAGLLPGAMLRNKTETFICKLVELEVVSNRSSFTQDFAAKTKIRLPIAHHEGAYYADEATLRDLEKNDRIMLRYYDNPNGSVASVAGVLSAGRNVMGMMPHPERAMEARLGNTDGTRFFSSMLRQVKEI